MGHQLIREAFRLQLFLEDYIKKTYNANYRIMLGNSCIPYVIELLIALYIH